MEKKPEDRDNSFFILLDLSVDQVKLWKGQQKVTFFNKMKCDYFSWTVSIALHKVVFEIMGKLCRWSQNMLSLSVASTKVMYNVTRQHTAIIGSSLFMRLLPYFSSVRSLVMVHTGRMGDKGNRLPKWAFVQFLASIPKIFTHNLLMLWISSLFLAIKNTVTENEYVPLKY